jgi:bifunctional enzyme CysN/CysC
MSQPAQSPLTADGAASTLPPGPLLPGGARAALRSYLEQHERKSLLRLITCGSVDDGKSTLIGRILFESQRVLDDQLESLKSESARHGTQGEALDLALLLDGLDAEREQGITIDVAYRFFDTHQRKYILADCPGHAQYTRNMATGASTADAAIVLVDARHGLTTQTRRHSHILRLFGVRHIILAVNKMDLVEFSEQRFLEVSTAYRELASSLGIGEFHAVPISALHGDNVLRTSPRTPWFAGASVLEILERLELDRDQASSDVLFPVQWINRPHGDFRGVSGRIAQGRLEQGDLLQVLPGKAQARVRDIYVGDKRVHVAAAGQAVTLTLDRALDISRGDLLLKNDVKVSLSDRLSARVVWMSEHDAVPGRSYWLSIGGKTVPANIREISHRIDIDSGAHVRSEQLELNGVAQIEIELGEPLALARFDDVPVLGRFILIDRHQHTTLAAGRIDQVLEPAKLLYRPISSLDRHARAQLKSQRPKCLWLTGLSGAGKSSIASALDRKLHARGMHSYVLDGDSVRLGINRDLGFSEQDREENLRRVAEIAHLMVDAGLIVIVSTISPLKRHREQARARFAAGEFIEAYVHAPLAVVEARDVKGLYAKARAGEVAQFTGISAPYEAPEQPELVLDTTRADVDTLAAQALASLLL